MSDVSSHLQQVLAQWKLELAGQPNKGDWSAVYPVRSTEDGQRAVLKLAEDRPRSFRREVEALDALRGEHVVKVLRADAGLGAMLLERLSPGDDLGIIGLHGDVVIAGAIMNQIRKPLSHATPPVPTTAELLDHFPEDSGPFANTLARRARKVMAGLVKSAPNVYLLHGDLHHGNLLQHRNTWVAIDPDPITGEKAYEAAAFLRNPANRFAEISDLEGFLARRVDRISQIIDADPQRVAGWAFARTALGVMLNPEGDRTEPWVRATEALDSIVADRSIGLT